MTFIQLAAQVQKEVEGEFLRLKQKEEEIDAKASSVANREALVLVHENELTVKDQEIAQRLEVVTLKELTVRRDTDVQADVATAERLNKEAADFYKKAKELSDDTGLKLEDLSKRELALSEREKVYEAEIVDKVTRNIMGIGRN